MSGIFKEKNLIKIAKEQEIFFKKKKLTNLEIITICELNKTHYQAKHIAEINKRG